MIGCTKMVEAIDVTFASNAKLLHCSEFKRMAKAEFMFVEVKISVTIILLALHYHLLPFYKIIDYSLDLENILVVLMPITQPCQCCKRLQ